MTDKGVKCDFEELVDEEEDTSALRVKLNLDLPSETDEDIVNQWNHKQFIAKVPPKSQKSSVARLKMRHRSVTTTHAATFA